MKLKASQNIVEQDTAFCTLYISKGVTNCILGSVIDFWIPTLKTTVVVLIIIVCMFQCSTRPRRINKVCIIVMKPGIM